MEARSPNDNGNVKEMKVNSFVLTVGRTRSILNNRRGFNLLENVIAIGVIAIVGVGLVTGLGTTFKMLSITNDRQHAKTLAEAQMEYVQKLPYQLTEYTANASILSKYQGYSVAPIVPQPLPSPGDANIQKITITVTHPFGQVTLVDYKENNNQ